MKNQVENHIFEDVIKEYQQILVDFVIDSGKAKSVDPKLQLVLGYLSIHKKLTQEQLKDLTMLSTGTISKKLRDILKLGMIKKERILGTNKYLYIVTPETFGNAADTAWREFSDITDFLNKKLLHLENQKEKKGSVFLSGRIKELLRTFEIVEIIWSDIQKYFLQPQKS